MLYSNGSDRRTSFDLPSSADGPVTCATCGCRLEASADPGEAVWFHFSPLGGRDARGCRVACVELAHDARGEWLEPAFA
jgi:hypothetical protein